ncbi:tRNA (adenine(37)-N6)-methyltransferase [Octopus bimaculoides]|uniref:tRNA (adenine(37)-N6)-methyltransferase n=1 Tax=Octopus bimaculoides TaxID=37653 RepID=UPI00071D24D5|nr:tRNA (adenine(37)-N6)-methyltransferase [Octopus bimaculoides]|eukprot:XP_014781937.1 PREDICTED: nef-associated protein 1-like [Octopus bimaculoides]
MAVRGRPKAPVRIVELVMDDQQLSERDYLLRDIYCITRDIESTIEIIFVFHKNNNAYFKAKVRPPRLDGRRIGLFATRAPYRPNPIGLTLAKIEKISGASIHFSGIDLLDGTPVLDVKPYIPQYDCPLGASHESVEKSNPSSHYHSASNQSPNVPPCPSSNFKQRKNSSNTEKIICSSATNSADVFAEDSTMLGVDSIENSTSGITEEDLDLRRKARNFCFTSKNYCLEDESLGQEKLQKTQAGEIFTHASSQGSEEDEKTNKTSTKNHNVCLSKFSSQSALIAVTNFVDLNSEAAVTPFFTTKESVALTPVVSTPLATAQADFTPLTKTQVDFTPLTTTPSESPTTKESMAFTLVASTLLTTTHTDSTPSDSTLLTTTLSESTPLTTTPVIEYTATSPAVATTPSFNTTSAQPLVSADWVVKAPVPKLTVFFTERSRLQLQKFSQHNKQQNYRLEFLQDSREVCQAICSILSEDPRSVYRRNLCKDSLYYFSVDKVHVTCWFFNNSAEVLRIQPMSYSEQSKSE